MRSCTQNANFATVRSSEPAIPADSGNGSATRVPLRQLIRDQRVIDGMSVTAGAVLALLVVAWLKHEPINVNSVCERPARLPPLQAVFYFPPEAQ